jgi:hypothetical protein
VIYSYNKSQRDALFLKFILIKNSTLLVDSPHVTSMKNTYRCLYSVEAPDDGQQTCPKHVEFFIKINLRNSASRWLLL